MEEVLLGKIKEKSAVIGIIGMGYVGLPLALVFAGAGFRVLGFDIDPDKVTNLNDGKSYIAHIEAAQIQNAVKGGKFEATGDFARSPEADVLIICVPTPLNIHREPDISYVTGTMDSLTPHIRAGQAVCLESTTYPGTTEEELRPRIESRGLTIGRDFFLVYSPEREDPANPHFHTRTIPKVCGGSTDACLRVGRAVYESVMDRVVAGFFHSRSGTDQTSGKHISRGQYRFG